MDQHLKAATTTADEIPGDPGFAPRFEELREACLGGSPRAALDKLRALHADADRFIESVKRGLFRAPLAWNDEQKAAGRWISLQHHRLARNARRVADLLAKDAAAEPAVLAWVAAVGLHHMAEAMKCEMADAPREPRHFGSLHAFMKTAVAGGWQRLELSLQVQAREAQCTVESLYFRALLLARSSGVLSNPQVEILDAWFWMWMPALRAVPERPDGPWLRVDLDSSVGLRRSPPPENGVPLYLPLIALERAYRSILEDFQNGVIVPAEGHASRFRIEEHMVVLDMARRTLRGVRREPVTRAARHASTGMAELHVGIAEIMARGFNAAAPPSVAVELVALEGRDESAARREVDNSTPGIYDLTRRTVQVVDVSASGVGLEGDLAECRELAVGDIVALRLAPDGPLELGKVARRACPAAGGRVTIGVHRATVPTESRVVIGVRQLSSAVQRLAVVPSSGSTAGRPEQMLFVPGHDGSGRQDAFLVPESALLHGSGFEADVGSMAFSFRLNRVRDRGRGWVLAGFEIFGMRKRDPLQAAA